MKKVSILFIVFLFTLCGCSKKSVEASPAPSTASTLAATATAVPEAMPSKAPVIEPSEEPAASIAPEVLPVASVDPMTQLWENMSWDELPEAMPSSSDAVITELTEIKQYLAGQYGQETKDWALCRFYNFGMYQWFDYKGFYVLVQYKVNAEDEIQYALFEYFSIPDSLGTNKKAQLLDMELKGITALGDYWQLAFEVDYVQSPVWYIIVDEENYVTRVAFEGYWNKESEDLGYYDFVYDSNRNVLQVNDSSGEWDSVINMEVLSDTDAGYMWEYDTEGRLTKGIVSDNRTLQIQYDENGLRSSVTGIDSEPWIYYRDEQGALIGIDCPDHYDITYGADGLRSRMKKESSETRILEPVSEPDINQTFAFQHLPGIENALLSNLTEAENYLSIRYEKAIDTWNFIKFYDLENYLLAQYRIEEQDDMQYTLFRYGVGRVEVKDLEFLKSEPVADIYQCLYFEIEDEEYPFWDVVIDEENYVHRVFQEDCTRDLSDRWGYVWGYRYDDNKNIDLMTVNYIQIDRAIGMEEYASDFGYDFFSYDEFGRLIEYEHMYIDVKRIQFAYDENGFRSAEDVEIYDRGELRFGWESKLPQELIRHYTYERDEAGRLIGFTVHTDANMDTVEKEEVYTIIYGTDGLRSQYIVDTTIYP